MRHIISVLKKFTYNRIIKYLEELEESSFSVSYNNRSVDSFNRYQFQDEIIKMIKQSNFFEGELQLHFIEHYESFNQVLENLKNENNENFTKSYEFSILATYIVYSDKYKTKDIATITNYILNDLSEKKSSILINKLFITIIVLSIILLLLIFKNLL